MGKQFRNTYKGITGKQLIEMAGGEIEPIVTIDNQNCRLIPYGYSSYHNSMVVCEWKYATEVAVDCQYDERITVHVK
jgi:hypothetical protein